MIADILCDNYLKCIRLLNLLLLTNQLQFDPVFLFIYFYEATYFRYIYHIDKQENIRISSKGQNVKKETSTYYFKKNNSVTEKFYIFDTDMK